jgi:hypothetical protein
MLHARCPPSRRPFVGLHTSPIDLCLRLPVFYYSISASVSSIALVGYERRRRETCSTLLRTLTVTPLAPTLSVTPLLLLCNPLCRQRSPRAAPSPAPPRCPAASCCCFCSVLASPDGAGTASPTCGDRSLGRQLAIEAAAQGEVLGPGMEALRPHHLLRLWCPDADDGGVRTDVRCMLQAYIQMFKIF